MLPRHMSNSRKFADSPLEQARFEPSVPRLGWAKFVARKDIPRANFGAGAAAVQLDLFCSASHSMQPTAHSVWAGCGFRLCSIASACRRLGLVYSPARYGNFEPVQELGRRVDLVVVLASGKTVISWRGFVTAMLTGRDKVARLAQPHPAATALCQ